MTQNPNPSPDPKREALIRRLRAMQKMTIENGCTEAEAGAAATAMARLMAEYNVDMTELQLRADATGCVADEFLDLDAVAKEWTIVTGAIARLFGVKHYFSVARDDVLGLGIETDNIRVTFYGLPQDVTAAIGLTAICHNAMMAELTAWTKATKRRATSLKRDFLYGMGTRLQERIESLITVARPNGSGGALMVLKDQLVKDEFAQFLRAKGVRLRRAGFSSTNPGAVRAGRAAGDRVNLRRDAQVGASSLRIAKQ